MKNLGTSFKSKAGLILLVSLTLSISSSISCQSKIKGTSVGGAQIKGKVIQPGQTSEVKTDAGTVQVPAGAFDEPVTIESEVIATDNVPHIEDKELASKPIKLETKTLDGKSLCDTGKTANTDLIVSFVIDDIEDRSLLEGLVIACPGTPKEAIGRIPNNNLEISAAGGGKINVSFKTREANAIFAIIKGNKIIAKTPTEVGDGIFVGPSTDKKERFQTRSVISLQLNRDTINDGENFSITNKTTNSVLVENQIVDFSLSSNLNLVPSDFDNASLFVKFYPMNPTVRAGFEYGKNSLQLDINNQADPRYSLIEFELKDFPIMAPATTAFGENRQIKGGFQGWTSMTNRPVVKGSNGTTLISNPSIMVNK